MCFARVHNFVSVCMSGEQNKENQSESTGATAQLICTEKSGVTLPDLLQSPIFWARRMADLKSEQDENAHPGLHKPIHTR